MAASRTRFNWVTRAFSRNRGALHRSLHVKPGQKIPYGKLQAAAKQKGMIGKRARLAITARGFHHRG
jgi:hypothetical protein